MTIYYVTPEGTNTTTAHDWANSCNITHLKTTLSPTLQSGDSVLLSAKAGENVYFTKDAIYLPVSFSGTAISRSEFKVGGHYTSEDVSNGGTRNTIPIIGLMQYPWVSANGAGPWDQFGVLGSYINVQGMNIMHGRFGIVIDAAASFVNIADTSLFNLDEGIDISGTDANIEKVNAKSIRKNAIRVRDGADRATIQHFYIDGDNMTGTPNPNGIIVESADNVSLKHGYIFNYDFTLTTDAYIQGDGITINSGSNDTLIEDVHIKGTTDRGIDSKSNRTKIIGCSVVDTKLGIGVWSNTENLIIASTVARIRAVRNDGCCIQNMGKVTLVNCHLSSGTSYNSLTNNGTILLCEVGAKQLYMVGGSIETDGVVPIAILKSAGSSVHLVNVNINGVLVTQSYVHSGSESYERWSPS